MGAMIFGGVGTERLQLNEDTLWSGGPVQGENPNARRALDQVREAVFRGDYEEADRLSKQMQGPFNQSYLPLGNLWLDFYHGDACRNYRRVLDLEEATVNVSFRLGEAQIRREAFASYPDQVMVVRIEADGPASLDFTARLDSPLRYQTSDKNGVLWMTGRAPSHVAPNYYPENRPVRYDDDDKGMLFACGVVAILDQIEGPGDEHAPGSTDQAVGQMQVGDDGITVSGAKGVTLLISAATSFNGYERSPITEGKDAQALVVQRLEAAQAKGYQALRADHIADYQRLFHRVRLNLNAPIQRKSGEAGGRVHSDLSSWPTDQRLARLGADDLDLVALVFQYGRYLLIASSRPGTQPANLQGIWNDRVRPPWSSNWTLNINVEMNYWPAEVTQLSECHQPLFDLIEGLADKGRIIADVNYGCRGWVAHHNADIWRQAAPVGDFGQGDAVWAMWAMAGPWLCQHLWEHYAFTGDETFLRQRAYPLMKEAALFLLDWLIEDAEGRLVTLPSTSPEHKFRTPDGQVAAISMASASDLQLIWDLFTNCIEAADTLGVDQDFRNELAEAKKRLYPMKVGKHGQLQEWFLDFEDDEPQHRHVSHLIGVYPGRQFTDEFNSELFEAAKTSLIRRGDGGTGWALAWKVALWARFGDGERAGNAVGRFMRLVEEGVSGNGHGGLYANLFDAHPPFQIDGNFGFTAGIAEMLLQSHKGTIDLLPALPEAWDSGSVSGLMARRGFEVDMAWESGALKEVVIKSRLGGGVIVRCGQNETELETEAGGVYRLDGQLNPIA